MGLECTEHTEYDAIFIMNDLKCTLKAFDFLRIIRNIGISTPLILLHDQDFRPDLSTEPGLPAGGFNAGSNPNTLSQLSVSLKFSNTLKKPFTCRDICLLIDQIFYFHFMSSASTPGSITSMPVSSNLNSQPSSEKRQCKVSRHCGKNESDISTVPNGNAFTTVPIFPSCPPPFNPLRSSEVTPSLNGMQPVPSQEQVAFFDYYQQPILSFSHSGSMSHQHWSTAGNTGTMHGVTMSGVSAGVAVTGTATAFTNGGITGFDAGVLNTNPTTTTASAINAVMDYEVGETSPHESSKIIKDCNDQFMSDGKGGVTSSEDSDSYHELKSVRKTDKGGGSQPVLRYPHHSLLSLMNVTDVQYV